MMPSPRVHYASHMDVDDAITSNMTLVHYETNALLKRIPSHVDADDLRAAGLEALTACAHSFDPTLGVPFDRYAARRIRGALLDELRKLGWLPRRHRAAIRDRDAARDRLTAALGRAPTLAELADALNTTERQLRDTAVAEHVTATASLDVIPTDAPYLPSTTTTPETVLIDRERAAILTDAVACLPDQARTVVVGVYVHEQTMRAIAATLGVTEARVSQIHKATLRLLRDCVNAQLDPDRVQPVTGQRTGCVARRRAAYHAAVAGRRTFRERLTRPADGGTMGDMKPRAAPAVHVGAPPKPPPLRQDVPIAPVGVYIRSRTGETEPVELRYDGMRGARHQWRSVEKYKIGQVWKVGAQWVPPLTTFSIDIRP